MDQTFNLPEGSSNYIIRLNNTAGTVSYLTWDEKKKSLGTTTNCSDAAASQFKITVNKDKTFTIQNSDGNYFYYNSDDKVAKQTLTYQNEAFMKFDQKNMNNGTFVGRMWKGLVWISSLQQ